MQTVSLILFTAKSVISMSISTNSYECILRFNQNMPAPSFPYTPMSQMMMPTMLGALEASFKPFWYPDSGASQYITQLIQLIWPSLNLMQEVIIW